MAQNEKEQRLISVLEDLESCIVAFSGGLDSAYLSVMANKHVKGRVLCVTLADPSTPRMDLESSIKLAEKEGLEHRVIQEDLLPDGVVKNPSDRCYFCKSCLFQRLNGIADEEGLAVVLDGENASDMDDNRPGRRAALEQKIRSPLLEAGLHKDDIRMLAESMGLEEAGRPPSACLSSRVPTGTQIENEMLGLIDSTEEIIRARGIRLVRARQEGRGVRIELGVEENTLENIELLRSMEKELRKLGWSWVAIDLGGYMPAGKRE